MPSAPDFIQSVCYNLHAKIIIDQELGSTNTQFKYGKITKLIIRVFLSIQEWLSQSFTVNVVLHMSILISSPSFSPPPPPLPPPSLNLNLPYSAQFQIFPLEICKLSTCRMEQTFMLLFLGSFHPSTHLMVD